MKIQISKENFDAKKRYSGVYQQQGRMLTDADWNELTDIVKYRLKEALRDVVAGGAPRERGFALLDKATAPQLKAGILYVEGTGVEILPDDTVPPLSISFEYDQQLDFPAPPPLPNDDGTYIFFSDQWQRTVNHLEDANLLDPGLHGADTCSRARQIGQIKWCSKGQEALLTSAPAKGNATLTLTLRRETAETDPCDPCASQVDLDERVGSYLFRVEVHAAELDKFGIPSRLILKWSRENGAEQYLAASVPANFAEEYWVYEFFNRTTEHHLGWNLATTLEFPDRPDLLPAAFPEDPDTTFPNHPWARRWDGYCILEKSGGDWQLVEGKDRMSSLILAENPDATAHGSVHFDSGAVRIFLEHIELQLTLGVDMLIAGDYWLAQVRESVHSSGDVILTAERPRGIEHRYLKLGEAKRSGGIWSLASLPGEEVRRFAFPPLTDVNAVEVGYTIPDCPIKQVSVNTLLKDKFGADWPNPGDINPSVRDILNTLLCDMDASLLPFRSKCDNGLYPPATRTVDDALTALCDIEADHVAYTGSSACSFLNQADIQTVQDALDALCNRPSGGGCRQVVSPDEPLAEIIKKLIEAGQKDICICLLPGDHDVQNGLDLGVTDTVTLSITGCGAGTRVNFAENPFSFNGFDSINICNLELLGAVSIREALSFRQCGSVNLKDVLVSSVLTEKGALISLRDVAVFNLQQSKLEAAHDQSLDIPLIILEIHPALKELFNLPFAAKFYKALPEVSAALVKMSDDQIKEFSEIVAQRMKEIDYRFSEREQRSYLELRESLLRKKRTASVVAEKLDAIRRETVRVTAGVVLLAWDGLADINLSTNDLVGEVSFYGPPGGKPLTAEELKNLQGMMEEGAISLSNTTAKLHAAENRVNRFTISEAMIETIRQIIKDGDGNLQGLVQDVFIQENVFMRNLSHFVCSHIHLTSNVFDEFVSQAAVIVAETAIYMGNRAGVETVLHNLTRKSQQTANLDLIIT